MNKFLYYLTARSLWIFIGIIGLALLIWFVGPLIAVGSVKPLANKYVRIGLITLIVGIWFARLLFKLARQAKRNAALVNEMKVAQEPILKNVSTDSVMSRQFAEIDEVLKNAKFNKDNDKLLGKFSNGQYLYQMPWYVVLGAAGSGKTTALKQSGLNFPLESSFGSSISGLAGTRDCDWFLTDQAVLLDTAGRLSLHDSHSEHDAYDWKEFITLLKKYRPKQPINGVIVTVGVDDLLEHHNDIRQLAHELRKRINEMVKYLGINFPVYLMITKLDMLNGFSEYFKELTPEQRERYLGFNFAALTDQEDSDYLIGYVSKQLALITDNINASAIRVLNGLPDTEQKNNAFIFADEFSKLNENLISLFRELYKSSKFETPILWRGIYFTSAQQDGTNFDPVFNNLSGMIGLTNKYSQQPQITGSSHSYFLNNLFTDVIFSEANLASEDKAWYVKHQFLYWMGVGSIATAATAMAVLILTSYSNNQQYLDDVASKATALQKEAAGIKQTSDLLQAVEFAEKVKTIAITPALPNPAEPPFLYRLGLYQGGNMNEVAYSSYQRILQDSVMPLISYKLDSLLRNIGSGQNIERYDALKAYLMMFSKEHFDASFMNNWLMRSFEKDSTIKNTEQKQKVQNALQTILSKQSITPSVPYDQQLVDLRRNEVAQSDMATMILSDAFNEITKQGSPITPVSFESMGGVQSKLIFTRPSGKSIGEPINPIYTKQAYLQFVLPALLKSTTKLYKEEDWVLGNYATVKTNEKDTLEQARKAYFDRYISTWNVYLSDIDLKQPQNLREARDLAKILSDTVNSPLGKLIKGIGDNTKLSITAQVTDKANPTTERVVDRVLSKAGVNVNVNDIKDVNTAYQATVQQDSPVDTAFTDFHLLTDKAEGQPAAIDSIILSVRDLYEYLDVLGIAVDKGVDLPSNESLYKYRSEVNRLPSPFRQMFDKFSDFILSKSLDEMNERLNKAKQEEAQKEQKAKEEAAQKEQQAKEEAEKQRQEQEQKEAQKAEDLKKQQEADLLVSLDKQLAPITQACLALRGQGYPFIKASPNNVGLEAFGKVFGVEGDYAKFTQLSPETASLAKASTLGEVIARGGQYQKFTKMRNILPVTQTYFSTGGNKPSVNVAVKVMSLDAKVDTLIINYGGTKYSYSHGPIVPYNLSWPMAGEDNTFALSMIRDKKEVGSVKHRGPWSLFRMVEAGTLVKQSDNETVVSYTVGGRKVALSFTTVSGKNPFNLGIFRPFDCPWVR